jgi:D-alanyl-D-alanine carboxypeptidase
MWEFFFISLYIFVSFFNWTFVKTDMSSEAQLRGYFLPTLSEVIERTQAMFWLPRSTVKKKEICAEIITPRPIKNVDSQEFSLVASSGVAYDLKHDFYLFEKEADKAVPIASISKLMSALVFLDHNPGWNTVYTIRESDKRDGNKLNFFPGEQVYVRDLFYSALVASDNSAIISLVSSTKLNEGEFVAMMNSKAASLKMTNSHFVEPTGLSELNVATARDVAKLIGEAMKDLDIRRAVLADKYELEIINNKKNHARVIKNTDSLLRSSDLSVNIVGGKTGYLSKAGYCFAGNFTKDNQEIITVVLGADSPEARFNETERLLNWIFKSYDWPKVSS